MAAVLPFEHYDPAPLFALRFALVGGENASWIWN